MGRVGHRDRRRRLGCYLPGPDRMVLMFPWKSQAMIPAQRLENILWQRTLRTFVTFSGGDPACHNVVTQTARTDLQGLESKGYLLRETGKRGHVWTPAHDLSELLDPTPGTVGRHRRHSRQRQRQSAPPSAAT